LEGNDIYFVTMKELKFTKIIATCGPSMKSKEIISAMIEAGVDLFRINFSHGTKEEWSYFIGMIRQVADHSGKNIAVMGDLQGPRIRVSPKIDSLFLYKDDLWKISAMDSDDKKTIVLDNPIFINNIKTGDKIVFDDGKIEVSVQSVGENVAMVKVINGGKLLGGKGVNIVGETVQMPSLTEKDKDDVDFAVKHNLDFLAMSFVKSGNDIDLLKSILSEKETDIRIVSKIETQQAIENLDEIIDNSFAIMVARGDLGITLPIARLPLLQREIIAKSIEKGKPVIVATQMMESMVTNSIPTRAEVTDVSNSIVEGADALLLTEETAIGKYPVRVIKTVVDVAFESEKFIKENKIQYSTFDDKTVSFSIANAAKKISEEPSISKIVAFTQSGGTALAVARNRPSVPIIALTGDKAIARQLSLVRGVYAEVINYFTSFDTAIKDVSSILKRLNYCSSGETVCITAGLPFGEKGSTNLLKIHKLS